MEMILVFLLLPPENGEESSLPKGSGGVLPEPAQRPHHAQHFSQSSEGQGQGGGGGGAGEPVGGEGGAAEQEGEGEEEQGGDKWVEEEQQAVGDPPQRGALRREERRAQGREEGEDKVRGAGEQEK